MKAMRRRAWLLALLALAVIVAAGRYPASAQEETTTTETTTTTDPPTTTSTTVPITSPPPTEPTTTTPITSPPPTSTLPPPPGTSPPTIIPPAVDDPNTHTDAPTEAVPIVDIVVPPREVAIGPYAEQQAFELARAVRGELRVARVEASQAQAAADLAGAQVHELEARLASLQAKIGTLRGEQRSAIHDLQDAQELLDERAANAYMRGNLSGVATVLDAADVNDYSNRIVLMESVLNADGDAIERLRRAEQQVGGDLVETAEAVLATQRDLKARRAIEEEARQLAQSARFDLAVFAAGGQIAIHGFTFPVGDPHTFSPGFGAPRMMGTPYAHWHEGTDILAPMGTELYATERGLITRMGTGGLGGITLWLKGESGTYYYYAHLTTYAEGIADGVIVEAGQVVGFVGDTGNARGGPPHLHFEIHPDGGAAVDPYPLLKVVDDLREQRRAAVGD